MIILGIDPGTARVGYGVIKNLSQGLKLVDYGCIKTEAKFSTAERLGKIDQGINKLIQTIRIGIIL